MTLYHVESAEPSDGLFVLSDGRYQLISGGKIAPMMSGPGYILVNLELANEFSLLQVTGYSEKKAVVFNRGTNTEYSSYYALTIERIIHVEEVGGLDIPEFRLYALNDTYLFVTSLLAEKLTEDDRFSYLQFSKGLQNFG